MIDLAIYEPLFWIRSRGPRRRAGVPGSHRAARARERARRDHPGVDRRAHDRGGFAAFAEHEAAVAPINSIVDILADPPRETITAIRHPKLGPVKMQNVIPSLSETPGRIDHPGPELGEHNREVYVGELGLSDEELAQLPQEEIV